MTEPIADLPGWSIETRLRDGTDILVRPVVPADSALLELGFTQLSDEARQLRFLRHVRALTSDELSFFSSPDHITHEAIGAGARLSTQAEDIAPAGVARYLLDPLHPDRAEVAVTVVDRFQGRGLGTLLFGLLAAVAARRGLRAFVLLVSTSNDGMRRLAGDLGARIVEGHGQEREYELDLQVDARAYPDTEAGRIFREASHLVAFLGSAGDGTDRQG